jgi:hypothetical protein
MFSIVFQNRTTTKISYWWVPLPPQVEVEEMAHLRISRLPDKSDARPHKILFGGAAGPGKSTGGRRLLLRRCLSVKNYECIILRESFPELQRSHIRRMDQEVEELRNHGANIDWAPSKFVCKFPDTGSILEFGHMEDENAVRKYLSTEYDGILADEAVKYPPMALAELIGRARTTKSQVLAAGGPLFLVSTNPGGPSARLIRDLFIDHTPDLDKFPQLADLYFPDEWGYVPANIEDNPYLDANYEADLAVNQSWRFRQLRYNDWDAISGQFFETFISTPTEFQEVVEGVLSA